MHQDQPSRFSHVCRVSVRLSVCSPSKRATAELPAYKVFFKSVFGCHAHRPRKLTYNFCLLSFFFEILHAPSLTITVHKSVGDMCTSEAFKQATCQFAENCPSLERLVKAREIKIENAESCGFADNHGEEKELFCCPIEKKTIDVPHTDVPTIPPNYHPRPPSKPAAMTK